MGRNHILIDLVRQYRIIVGEGINLLVGHPCCRQSRCNTHDRSCSPLASPQDSPSTIFITCSCREKTLFASGASRDGFYPAYWGVLPDAHFFVHIGNAHFFTTGWSATTDSDHCRVGSP